MLDAIKRVVDDNFVFQQHSPTAAVQKLSTSFLLSYDPVTVQSLVPLTMRFKESYTTVLVSTAANKTE